MSRIKCENCEFKKSCGSNQVIGVYKDNGEIITNGAFYKDNLLTNGKLIVVNFNRPANTVFIPPKKFEIMTYEKTRNFINKMATAEPHTPNKCRYPGSFNKEFEEAHDEDSGNMVILKTIDAFQEVIKNTSLKILFINTGLPDTLERVDFRPTSEQINSGELMNKPIELVLDIIYSYFPLEAFLQKTTRGKVYSIGKTFGELYGAKKKLTQRIFINKLNNTLIYTEKFKSGDLEIKFTFENTNFIPKSDIGNPTNIDIFATSINKQIRDELTVHPDREKFVYMLQFNIEPKVDKLGFERYYITFKIVKNEFNPQPFGYPDSAFLSIPEEINYSRTNTFGINLGEKHKFPFNTFKLPLQNKPPFILDTFYYNTIWFTESATGVLLHEFCHVLGMIHEFTKTVETNPYYKNENCWKVKAPFYLDFDGYTTTQVYDVNSVMMYVFFGCEFKKENRTCAYINTRDNNWLSAQDKLHLNDMYPVIWVEPYYLNKKYLHSNFTPLIILTLIFIIILILIMF